VDNNWDFGTDPDLFERFYREHVEAVERFVARRVEDPHASADLTADIFVAVIQASETYRPELGPPRAWLFGIARNVVSLKLRDRTRQSEALQRFGAQRVLQPDAIERALERIDAAAEARELRERILALPPRLRAVLELVVVDDLSVNDAASALHINPGTARVRLHRARKKLGEDPQPGTDPHLLAREAES
jgi:RNA polymerase sigma-70 factor (ECF subfamily)